MVSNPAAKTDLALPTILFDSILRSVNKRKNSRTILKIKLNKTIFLHLSFEEVSTPGQTQTGLGPRVYPFTTPGCCTAWIRCWQ